MRKIKNYIMICILSTITFVGFLGICEGQKVSFGGTELNGKMPYEDSERILTKDGEDSTELGDRTSIKEKDKTIIIRLLEVFGLDNDINRDHKFIDYARAIINMALGLIAFIALIMTIYTFYMMLFSDNEAGIKKAKGNLVGIFIALGIIGLAWIIVSFIFRWYQANWKAHEDEIKSGKIGEVGEFYD